MRRLFSIFILFIFIISWTYGSGSQEKDAAAEAETEQSGQAAQAEERGAGQSREQQTRPERGPDGVLRDPGIPPVSFHKKFDTDFGKSTVYFNSIISGGPEKDEIPSISSPVFTDVSSAASWIGDSEPVLLLRYKGQVRIYPIQILMWHEIVNDSIEGDPVSVSYCPLTNTAIAYLGRLDDGTELTFGTTGRLRFSNAVMYDRQSETWWQQATGEGIVGTHAGDHLQMLPLTLIPWREVEQLYDSAEVLSRESGFFDWPYGENPYLNYDTSPGPFLYRGPDLESEFNPFERVLVLQAGEDRNTYSYNDLKETKLVNDELAGREVTVFWQAGTVSPVDTALIVNGRDIGSAQAYYPELDGRTLNFYWDGVRIRDRETESVWSLSGQAVSGELQGSQLEPVVSVTHFGYSWTVFYSGQDLTMPENKEELQ